MGEGEERSRGMVERMGEEGVGWLDPVWIGIGIGCARVRFDSVLLR